MKKKTFPKKTEQGKSETSTIQHKTINIKLETWNRLQQLGKFGDTADSLLSRLLDSQSK